MKNLNKVLLTVLLTWSFAESKSQNLDFQNVDNLYDMMQVYYQSENSALPDSLKGPINKEFERTFKIWAPRLYPSGNFSVASNAIQEVALSAGSSSSCTNEYSNVTWEEKGPIGLPLGSLSKGVGRIHRVVFDPQYDGNSNQVIYASSEHSGLWRTENNGEFWQQVNTDNGIPFSSVSDVAIDYNNSNNIFISTGLADVGLNMPTGDNNSFTNPIWTTGVYRSTNYGVDWQPINEGLLSAFDDPGAIRNIETHPTNSNIVCVATSEGFFKTENALASVPTWVNSSVGFQDDQELRGLCFKPDNSDVIYLSGKDIYRSINGGQNWTSMTGLGTGLDLSELDDNFQVSRINLAVTPANSLLLYAYVVGSYEVINSSNEISFFNRAYVFKYDGTTWEQIEMYEPMGDVLSVVHGGWIGIAVSPVEEDFVVYGHTVLRSRRISQSNFQSVAPYNDNGIHADVHDVKFSPIGSNPNLFIAHHGGVSTGVVGTTGLSFTYNYKYNGLGTSTIWTFDVTDMEREGILIGTQDNGTSYIDDLELNWKQIGGGDGYTAAISNPLNPKAYYNFMTARSMFPFSSSGILPVITLIPSIQYAGYNAIIPKSFPNIYSSLSGKSYFGFSNVYERIKMEEPGDSWDDVWEYSSDIGLSPIFNNEGESWNVDWRHKISVLAASQSNPNIVYVGIGGVDMGPGSPPYVKPALLKSNSGFTEGVHDPNNPVFFDITPNLPTIPSTGLAPVITGIAIDPYDEDHAWVSFSGYYSNLKVWETFDGGLTWQNSDPEGSLSNLPVNDIAVQNGSRHLSGDSRVFIGTDAGIYYKETGTDCWMKYGNIPNVRVTQIKMKPCENSIYAATYGRGVWKAFLPDLTSDLAETDITENLTWDTERFFTNSIRIKSGSTLTLSSTLFMPLKGKIIVEENARLIINSGRITAACGNMWQGIEVLGNPNLNQTNANQGEVRILNGGTIEYALVGVSLGTLNPNNTPNLNTTGGFVRGYSGATFLNCKQAVRAYDYQSPNGAPNRTVFNNTTFEISEELPGGIIPQTQVQLRGVNGVVFNNSAFLNSRSDEHSIYHAGSGISSGYSSFKVTACEFENLLNGIKVKSLGFDNISVQNSTFNLNLQGVQLRYSGIANVSGNTFLIPTPNEIDYGGNMAVEPYGIYLISSTGYEVEENSFFSSEIHKNVGIAIRNSGNYSNQIYKNSFHTLEAGIIAMKDNRYDPIEGSSFYEGLIFKCNEFGDENTPLNYSIALTDEGEVAMFQGIMGVPGGGAGNLFFPLCSPGTTDKEFYVDETTPITSVVVYIPYVEEETRPDCNTATMVAVPLSTYENSPSHCPSNISSGGVIGVFQEKYMTNRDMLATIKAVYDNTANGGDTQYLLDLIANSNISSFDLRNELLLASPDVTDRVLIEAIARDPEMNPWHLAQVLLANSPLPRNVINVLEKSDVQEYYRELVLNGQNGGMTNTTIMQMEQGYFSTEVETSRMDYVRLAYFGDSTFTWNDSIIYYLSDAAGHQHKKTLLSYHIMRRQYQEAQNILNDSQTYQWSQDYLDVMNVIMEAFQDTSNADEVVRLNQVLLETIANEDNSEAHLAQALLESFDLATYDYDVVLPSMQPKSLKQIRNNNSGKSSFATVHPNPAQNNIYLSWNLPEGMNPEKVTLSIYNIHGKQMLSNTLNQHLGIQEIGINQWPAGMYLYQLQHDGIRLHSDKFEVFK